jgi:hypothetical protein
MNFNTNQARHFYVAKAKQTSIANVAAAGDLAMLSNKDYIYFVYKNADGEITRSDTIPVKGIEYYNKRTAAQMATKLMAYTVALDTNAYSLSDLVDKTLTCNIAVREFISYDLADSVNVTAAVKVTSAMNTAALFHKALAIAIAKALPKRDVPYFKVFSSGSEVTASTAEGDVTGSSDGVVLVATQQKWVRGKLSGEPFDLAVSFNVEDEAWGTVAVAPSAISNNTVIPATYMLADLEWFCLGERGDVYRGYNYPNDYTPTYMINPADTSTNYDMLTIQYFWQGKAETIQKSPRTIHIAGPAAAIKAWTKALDDLTGGNEAGSGS